MVKLKPSVLVIADHGVRVVEVFLLIGVCFPVFIVLASEWLRVREGARGVPLLAVVPAAPLLPRELNFSSTLLLLLTSLLLLVIKDEDNGAGLLLMGVGALVLVMSEDASGLGAGAALVPRDEDPWGKGLLAAGEGPRECARQEELDPCAAPASFALLMLWGCWVFFKIPRADEGCVVDVKVEVDVPFVPCSPALLQGGVLFLPRATSAAEGTEDDPRSVIQCRCCALDGVRCCATLDGRQGSLLAGVGDLFGIDVLCGTRLLLLVPCEGARV